MINKEKKSDEEIKNEDKNKDENNKTKDEQKKEAYVVRGARMICSCGSHKRRINLPISHGSYVKEKPIMFKNDYVSEYPSKEKYNIPYFGICSNSKNKNKEVITLAHEKTREPIDGIKCTPKFLMPWEKCKKDMFLGEMALTTSSILYCAYGGVISFVTSGQEKFKEDEK
ncbi:DUF4280 domain-containing protein [Peptostreptococcaceae bacterium AGR-M142]